MKLCNINLKEKISHNNFSPKQRQAIKNILENNNIIIKEANNRSAVIILNKTWSRTKIQEILKDWTNYRIRNTNKNNDVISKLTKFYTIYNETLTKKRIELNNKLPPKN